MTILIPIKIKTQEMKNIYKQITVIILSLVLAHVSYTQTNELWSATEIEPYHLTITLSKTTNVIFPYAIVSADIGSRDVLVQKAKGVENILQIKAAKEGFLQTNISVITTDGKFTSLLVDYDEKPAVLNLSFLARQKIETPVALLEEFNQRELERYAALAVGAKQKISGIKATGNGIQLRLNGIFIHDQFMVFRLHINNETNINYDIDQFRFYIRDQKKSKRTATQEIEIRPLLTQNSIHTVKNMTENTAVFVVPKFTIPDKKYLAIQMMEKNGGRHLQLKVKNPKIIKALLIE